MPNNASNFDMDKLVSDITNEITQEKRIAEGGYLAADLGAQIKQFDPAEAAWEISYKTASADAIRAGLGSAVAWQLGYVTTKGSFIKPGLKSRPE
jgi:hypothetical protein